MANEQMIVEEIFIGGKKHIVTEGDHPCGRGHSIAFAYGRNVRADFIKGGKFSDTLKFIEAELLRVQIDTDELKPLFEYFKPMPEDYAPGTAELLDPLTEKVIQDFHNTSANEQGKAKRYSYYYGTPPVGTSGTNLFRMALALHILINFGVWILNKFGQYIQPVTFGQEPTENDFEVEVSVVDGIAPFIYSKSGDPEEPGTWQASNILLYDENERENARIFVLDSAGTIASDLARFTNGNTNSN